MHCRGQRVAHGCGRGSNMFSQPFPAPQARIILASVLLRTLPSKKYQSGRDGRRVEGNGTGASACIITLSAAPLQRALAAGAWHAACCPVRYSMQTAVLRCAVLCCACCTLPPAGDISLPATMDALFAAVEGRFGGQLTAFVHNAGLYIGAGTLPPWATGGSLFSRIGVGEPLCSLLPGVLSAAAAAAGTGSRAARSYPSFFLCSCCLLRARQACACAGCEARAAHSKPH